MNVASRRPRFALLLALVALAAFAVREQFVLFAIVDHPIRGDTREYVLYAWNLVHHGVFGGTPPSEGLPAPDAYRSPGFPWLIALGMQWFPPVVGNAREAWYAFALQAQVLLGTASVVLVVLLAREWLKPAWAIAAGLLLAFWPHHVAATGALLSEVLFGFCLVFASYALARALRPSGHRAWFAVAGAGFGYAFLINPLVLLFPPIVAVALWCIGQRRGAAMFLAVFLLPVLVMGVRNARLDDARGSGKRAEVNFVQGSWPPYHLAANRFRIGDPIAIAIMEEIEGEIALIERDPAAGLTRIGRRLAQDPVGYAWWYANKPALLWSWQIRIGASDLHVLKVRNSPLERNKPLRAMVHAYRWVNPGMTLLALLAALVLPFAARHRADLLPAACVAGLVLYVTALHTVLQAEPRYATAYRPLEVLLVATALAWAFRRLSLQSLRRRGAGPRH